MQLCQAKAVGTLDQYDRGIGYIHSHLDHRRAHQHVGLAVHEAEQNLLQFVFAHLAMAHRDPCSGHLLLNPRRAAPYALHAVVHEVHLPAAAQLLFDGRPHQVRVELRNHRLHCQPVLGRRFDDRHIAQPE